MFDSKKFNQANFEPMTSKVLVPEITDFFQGEPEWEVRGLTGVEIAQVEQAADVNNNLNELMTVLMAGGAKDKAKGVKEVLGIMEGAPPEYVKCLEKVVRGTVFDIDKPTVVKIAQTHPTVFYRLVAEINELSGKGQTSGKLPASTKKQK